MSHIESARQEVSPEQQPAGGEQDPEPEVEPETEPESEQTEPDPLPQDRGPANPPQLSIADVTAAEGDGTLDFRVSVSRAPGAAVSVRYETENGTAAAGSDYEPASGTLQFPPGSTAALPIQVTVHDDAVAEAAETFVVRLSNAQGAGLAAAAATGTITDNDTRALVVRPGELTVLEGGSAEFEVELGSQPTGPVTVGLDDGPELAVDPGELRFEPGTWQDARTVTVTAAQDEDSAADDPVLLRVAARGGGYDGVQESVQVTTAEDDTATLAISGARAAEGAGRLRFELTLTAASSAEVSVSYATGSPDDSATAGDDYRAGSDTVRFAAGSAGVRTIEVTVHDDTTDEPDEQVTITLSNARNAVLVGGAATLTAVGVIEDDDEPPRVGIGDSSASEGNPQGELLFTVTLARASGRVVTVRYATGNVTAASGSDYTAVDGALTFAPGVRQQTVAVPVANDTLDEDSEQFTVTLSAAMNATLDPGARSATGTITDDDDAPGLSIDNAQVQEDAGHLHFPVTLDNPSGKTVTVAYSTADGTATAGSDYTAANGTLTFTAGSRAQTIAVPVTDDSLDEDEENLTMTLQSPANATLTDAGATGTITDNDGTPGLSIDDATAAEDAGHLRFPVTLDAASARVVTVSYATANGTATAGSDYTAANGTLTFTAGSRAQTIAVPVTDDSLDEDEESLTITLQSPANATLTDASATGTITDNDDSGVVTPVVDDPGLSIANAQAQEDAGHLHFPVTLDSASTRTVTVSYTTSDGSAATSAATRTATGGSDYTAASGMLTFTAGTLAQTIAVPVTNDSTAEEEEALTVTLQSPSGATLDDSSAIGIIVDDDGPDDDHGDFQLTATTVVAATATAAQDTISGHLETEDDIDYFRVVVDGGETVRASINPSTQSPNHLLRAWVRIETANYTSVNADGYDAAAVSSSTTVYAVVWSRFGTPSYTLAIALDDAGDPAETSFDIDLVYASATKPSASDQAIIRAAADKWESVITKGLPAQFIWNSDQCQNGDHHEFGTFQDDLVIEILVEAIDGFGGVGALAGTCVNRWGGGLPAASEIILDSTDINWWSSSVLRLVALHEMGHALGFGTVSRWDDLLVNSARDYQLDNPDSTTLPDAYFSGTAAVSAFNEIASSYTGGKVPVENDTQTYSNSLVGGSMRSASSPEGRFFGRSANAALDGHWRESVFDTEVMATRVAGSDKLSKVTIAALADLGYSVDYTEAESYSLPSSTILRSQLPDTALPGLPHFRDEVRRGPLIRWETLQPTIPIIP